MAEKFQMRGKTLQKWKETSPGGEVIKDGLFLPFKAPYENTHINEDDQFTTAMALDFFHLRGAKVGLVIDLTKTDRYYDPYAFTMKGIKHFKLPCRGYDSPPTEEETAVFIAKCKSFIKENPDKCIGVHCTNGLNRTGFLICAYLAEVLKMDIHDAIELFNTCRPPGIQKDFDREELIRRYGTAPDLSEDIAESLGSLNIQEKKPKQSVTA